MGADLGRDLRIRHLVRGLYRRYPQLRFDLGKPVLEIAFGLAGAKEDQILAAAQRLDYGVVYLLSFPESARWRLSSAGTWRAS
jgi:hypothetical protein